MSPITELYAVGAVLSLPSPMAVSSTPSGSSCFLFKGVNDWNSADSLEVVQAWIKTAILSWLQNDGTRGFSKDQLKGKQLYFQCFSMLVLMRKCPFHEHANWELTSERKTTFESNLKENNFWECCFPLSWSLENPLVPSWVRIIIIMSDSLGWSLANSENYLNECP